MLNAISRPMENNTRLSCCKLCFLLKLLLLANRVLSDQKSIIGQKSIHGPGNKTPPWSKPSFFQTPFRIQSKFYLPHWMMSLLMCRVQYEAIWIGLAFFLAGICCRRYCYLFLCLNSMPLILAVLVVFIKLFMVSSWTSSECIYVPGLSDIAHAPRRHMEWG